MSLLNLRNIIFSPTPDKTTKIVSAKDVYPWTEVVEDLPELGPIHGDKIEEAKQLGLYYGDITKIGGDKVAIVNAANITLRKGGGVSGSIHRAAGPDLEKACVAAKVTLNVSECMITGAYSLPCARVIHSLTPSQNQDKELWRTYLNAMKLALDSNMDTVIFPALSIGSHFFTPERGTEIAVMAGLYFLKQNERHKKLKVVYCAYEQDMLELFKGAFTRVLATSKDNDKGWEMDFA